MSIRPALRRLWPAFLGAVGFAALFTPARGLDVDPRLQKDEQDRIALIEKIKAPVLAVLAPGGQGGGSGEIITEDGYAVTNFHVAAAVGSLFHCGMANGEMYDAVLVGLDRPGDLCLIKLIQKPNQTIKFPTVAIGDSDQVKPGDMTVALGNPLLLATDFNPTATFGMVSGVHRYQKIPHPTGTLLEYCDCIQVDTAINPGNSGGPLFNMKGEWIGINSAGSLGKSDRINSGAAYAISVNMVKNFLGHLRAGLECDHATLGAEIDPENEDGGLGRLVVGRMLSGSEVDRRGLAPGDVVTHFGGVLMTNLNQFKNRLGIYPKGWRVPMTFRHDVTEVHDVLVRLPGRTADVLPDKNPQPGAPPEGAPADEDSGPPPLPPPPPNTDAAKLFVAKPGFANYYFNKLERDALIDSFHRQGDFTAFQGPWSLRGDCTIAKKPTSAEVAVRPPSKDQKDDLILGTVDGTAYKIDPLDTATTLKDLMDPPDSGGMLLALYQYRQLMTQGEKGFIGQLSHGGVEPFYPPSVVGSPPDYRKRVMCDVLRTKQAGVATKWYFRRADQDKWYMPQAPTGELIGFEVSPDHDEDPCEVYLADYAQQNGGSVPGRIEVVCKGKTYAVMTNVKFTMEK
ncbi:MAG TPA: trypsin-like peptidase domain-containing protein [Gemmataceae bacterium]|nr:trypsin-like peptidase domain-containing protein [Gemmataceae bacterium]